MIGFIILEKQWQDEVILFQHILNEIALYLILIFVLVCAISIPAHATILLGWSIVIMALATITFNMIIIAYIAVK